MWYIGGKAWVCQVRARGQGPFDERSRKEKRCISQAAGTERSRSCWQKLRQHRQGPDQGVHRTKEMKTMETYPVLPEDDGQDRPRNPYSPA